MVDLSNTCLYQKAFWIVVPALIVIFSGLFGYINDKVDANATELHLRHYPINVLIPDINEEVEKNSKNVLIICKGLQFDCIE